jgi:chromate transporter
VETLNKTDDNTKIQGTESGKGPVSANVYVDSFKTFFKIGLFTIGGGYAMIPMIEAEVVDKHQWLNKDDFMDLLAIAQSCPGIFAVNMSIFIGYRLRGVKGGIVTALGTILPSFLIILAIALFFQHFRDNRTVAAIFKGIRPAVVALIAVPCWNMGRAAHIGLTTIWIPVVSALLIWLFGVSPIYIIIAAGLGGYIYGRLADMKNEA